MLSEMGGCAQSLLTLCDPMDCSLPGSSVRVVSQARVLEWVAISFSGTLPDLGTEPVSLGFPTPQTDSLPLCQLGSQWETGRGVE